MKEKASPSACGADIWVQAHLGRKLRELFEGLPEALPPRLVELVKSLAAKDKQHPAVNTSLKHAMLALIPNLRALPLRKSRARGRPGAGGASQGVEPYRQVSGGYDPARLALHHPSQLFIEFLDEPDPIAFFCRVLADESAPIEQRKAAAQALRPYYHPMLAQVGPFLDRFLDRRK